MRAPFNWSEASVVVTGASRGIGLAIATEALSRGARVGLIARSSADLDRAASRLRTLHTANAARIADGSHATNGSRAEHPSNAPWVATAVADVGSRSQLEGALDEIAAEIGPADVLVNNAGTGAYGPFGGGDLDALKHALRVNYLGTVYGTRAVLPGMLERRRGHVVNIASVAGRVATPGESAYSASKFAVVGFTQCVAMELRGSGVGISMILPGPVDTSGYFTNDEEYKRSFPPKVSVDRVAKATLGAVDKHRLEVVVPPWFRIVATIQTGFSGVIGRLPARMFDHDDSPG